MPFNITLIICLVVFSLIGYFFGSLNFAILITRKLTGGDIRKSGSGNAGMTNVMRSVGLLPGLATFLLDLAKAAISVLIGKYLFAPLFFILSPQSYTDSVDYVSIVLPIYGAYLCGLMCFIGHIYPLYFNFKGGKGITATLGVMLVLNWQAALTAFGLFLIIASLTRIVSVSSIIAAISMPFLLFLSYYLFPIEKADELIMNSAFPIPVRWIGALFGAVFTVVVILKHSTNIKRLLKGEEKRLSLKK